MGKLSAKINEEIEALLPPTIFFFVALHIVSFVRALMLRGTGIAPFSLDQCLSTPTVRIDPA
jgi:hypothetical protein